MSVLTRLKYIFDFFLLKKSDLEQALKYAEMQITTSEILADNEEIFNNCGLLAEIYTQKKNYDNAIIFYEKQLDACQKMNDKNEMFNVLGNLGRVYYKTYKFKKALECTKRQRGLTKELTKQKNSVL